MELPRFDPRRVAAGRNTLIIGRRRAGKSYLTRDLLVNLTPSFVACRTPEATGDYLSYVDHDVVETFDPGVLAERLEENVVLDDCCYDRRLWDVDGPFVKLLKDAGRGTVFTCQHVSSVPPDLPFNFVMLFRDPQPDSLQRVHARYFSHLGSLEELTELMRQTEADHRVLVIDNLEGRVWWYRAAGRRCR